MLGSGICAECEVCRVIGLYETISLVIVITVLTAALSIIWMSWRNGITPMPSSPRVRRAVAEEVNGIGEGGLLVEAGSGWGTLGVYLAKHCEGWRVLGVENSPLPLAFSRVAAWLTFGVRPVAGAAGDAVPFVKFLKDDIYRISYREAQAVVFYLYPGAMRRLGPLLAEQLAPGASIVSVCFALPGWKPEKTIVCKDIYRTRIYVYKKPLEETEQVLFQPHVTTTGQLLH